MQRGRSYGRAGAAAVAVTALSMMGGSTLAVVAGAGSAAGAATVAPAAPAAATGSSPTCALGNGVKHVIELTFDNVHFYRDNPNVPSDLEMMPHLLQYIEGNGTLLSNSHTPLIAHTADDSLTTYTGLYGDRHGMPISNSYQAYNADGTTDPAGSFAYWTDQIYDTASHPNPGHDTNPSMVYSATPPATTTPAPAPDQMTPAPWVPFTRAGCDVGDVATANMVLENTSVDIPKVFGAGSAEAAQLAADPNPYKDAEAADYVGIGVHCASGSAFCASARAVKYGHTTPSRTAVSDTLPSEPGGYTGFQALFGHRYVAPQVGAGTPDLSHHGYAVTNAAGNLVDLSGNQIDGAYVAPQPGFPGFGGINASQTLAYVADMQEAGVPVTYGYIADVHGNQHINDPAVQAACAGAGSALGTGSPCYVAQARYYDQAFATFFGRLAADGFTKANTLFVVSSDEGDHVASANVGRALQPTPTTCDGATVHGTSVMPDVPCSYPAGTFGELNTNVTGLLATEKADTTPFSLENDAAPQFYVTGNPSPSASGVRALERDAAGLTAANPYSGNTKEKVANYLADPTEEAILHMVNADPARTPTFTLFAKPDYYLYNGAANCSSSCVAVNPSYAYNHGDYAPEINTNYVGLVGPGVATLGLDGTGAARGPSSAGPNSGQGTIPGDGVSGTWLDETDIRPTLLYLSGLKDDYQSDGRVVSEVLTAPTPALAAPGVTELAACYKQLNSSVGVFGTSTLQADTRAIRSSSTTDRAYSGTLGQLRQLEQARDDLTAEIKLQLSHAAFQNKWISLNTLSSETGLCGYLLKQATQLAAGS